jgi:hypothetical protein
VWGYIYVHTASSQFLRSSIPLPKQRGAWIKRLTCGGGRRDRMIKETELDLSLVIKLATCIELGNFTLKMSH